MAFKLQNLRAVGTDKGLKNVSKIDQETWQALGRNPAAVSKLAAEIRANARVLEMLEEGADGPDEEFAEGTTATQLHTRCERNRTLRKKLIDKCIKSNQLYCRACGDTGPDFGSDYRNAIFEAHHIHPLAGGPARQPSPTWHCCAPTVTV